MAASLGRPVRLSSVEMRLLPLPGFVLYDLTVDEDPAYGAEPVLHANTVTANIRLLSLWRGRLEIGSISVDEASLNLVRTPAGHWNLEPLFRSAAEQGQAGAGGGGTRGPVKLPYLEATNSRINIKRGAEKLPYSLVNADLSFWQEEPGDWRIRLRGQPARTDVSLDLADTGVVRLEASLRRAAELRLMPVHLDMEWREAQLGQLARLVIGSDPGWRGDLTGEVHVDGSSEAAQVRTRLRATGVHREEFAPVAPMDFDANCGFTYHFPKRAMENLVCDSPLGDGRVHLAGEWPGVGRPDFSVALDKVPLAAGLDALRTVRNGIGPGLVARGAVSGKIAYAEEAAESSGQQHLTGKSQADKGRLAKSRPASAGPLTGSLTVEGFELSGPGLSTPIRVPKLLLEPAEVGEVSQGREPERSRSSSHPPVLSATFAIPAGGTAPLTMTTLLRFSGYSVIVHGQASLARAREMAQIAGLTGSGALDALAGDPAMVDLSAQGPWLAPEQFPFSIALPATNAPDTQGLAADRSTTDSVSGTLTLHHVNWKAGFLANRVDIAEATLHFDNTQARWDPVVFSYGPVKGTASLDLSGRCEAPEPCLPRFEVQFGDLDASALQAAILGAREPGTLLSELIARLSPSASPAWPQLEGTVTADSLVLGPVTLEDATATLRVLKSGAEITGLDASLLGGHVHGAGTLRAVGAGQDKPLYTLTGQLEKLSPPALGQLLGLHCSGGVFNGEGKIELSGFTDKDLAASVKGTMRFDWRHGGMSAGGTEEDVPAALARFDRWSGDAEIADGAVALKENQIVQGVRKRAVEAVVTLGDPPTVTFGAPAKTQAER
jgi:hypothetical protein